MIICPSALKILMIENPEKRKEEWDKFIEAQK